MQDKKAIYKRNIYEIINTQLNQERIAGFILFLCHRDFHQFESTIVVDVRCSSLFSWNR